MIDHIYLPVTAPGLRPQFDPRYYAANVLDPDGYNVEICYKPWLYE